MIGAPCSRLSFSTVFAIAGIALFAAAEEPASSPVPDESLFEDGLYSSHNAYFEVIGGDQVSTHFVASLSEALMQRFTRSFALTGRFNPRILVTLVPADEARFGAPFETVVRDGAHITVNVRWGPDTSRAMTERALAQGLLTRLSFGYTREEAVHVPLWVELALQHQCRLHAVSSHRNWLRQRMEEERPLRLSEILKAERGGEMPAGLEENAFWLWTVLDREGRRGGEMRSFLVRILRGDDPDEALLHAYGGRFQDLDEAGIWWLVGLNESLRLVGGPMMSAEESSRWIGELSRVTVAMVGEAEDEGESGSEPGEERLVLRDLWEHRGSAEVVRQVTRRLQRLEITIGRAHPYFHNAYLSLGSALESLLASDEDRFREAEQLFRADMREGRELMKGIADVLDDLSEELADQQRVPVDR